MTTNMQRVRVGGVAEVAEELGVSRQQVAKLRQREDFPAPVASLSVGEVWDLNVIARWANSGLRRRAGRPGAEDQRLAVGRRFELMDQLGDGGFAVVHRARDLHGFNQEVAVKVLQDVASVDEWCVARFQQELRVMSELSDPHVMPVLDSGTDERLGLWYAMPLALGSLADVVGPPMDAELVVAVMRDVCSGLIYIHRQGILHRDLKPANVLRTRQGKWAIADFGLAKTVVETDLRLTSTTEGFGTVFYVAPEQWKGAKRVDEQADIYSAGKIMQALVSGETPSDDDVPAGRLRAVILRAISKDPARRYGSAAEFLSAIESALAPVPTGLWESPGDRGERLRARLKGDRLVADATAIAELVRWSEGPANLDGEYAEFCRTLRVLQHGSIAWWWEDNPGEFERVMTVFTGLLDRTFDFTLCDGLADFARRAVAVTNDAGIMQRVVTGLTVLGWHHNRWHVQDVVVAILQGIKSEDEAAIAMEGLRIAGRNAVSWTVGSTAVQTFHPILRAGLNAF
ncbi:serine/threonine protein kinase [Streptosporangiaceae bacterium NEAU-GS5]|nr:serine/threonine protein kinase [Streptosporangiaceae bacterium NEAU-GS5]